MNKLSTNCVDLALLITKQPHQHFTCSICLQFMANPVKIDCQLSSLHIFGSQCISEWIAKNDGNRHCPLCRNKFSKMDVSQQLSQQVKRFGAKCPACQTVMPISQINIHIASCEPYLSLRRQALKRVVEQQMKWLQKQIDPHLRDAHTSIFQTYVKEWQWLSHDPRNWKWWWWCSNPWWENKACPACNQLWHKYQKDIDELQDRRIELLKELGIGQLLGLEGVECESG